MHTYHHPLFRRFFADSDGTDTPSVAPLAWTPPFDVVETAEAYEVTIDLPGVLGEDVEVGFEDGVLSVHGERRPATLEEGQRAIRRGRVHGRFARRLAFHDEVEVDTIQATCRDGVLRVTVPKSEKSRPRQIPISVH